MILTKEIEAVKNPDKLIDEKIAAGNTESFLLIVPTNRKKRSITRGIISSVPGAVAGQINVETLGTLTEKILKQYVSFTSLSEAASSVFIKQSTKKENLKYLKYYQEAIPRGTLERIKNVIKEYKRHGITPTFLEEEAENLEGAEKLKALDIAGIYREYREKCKTIDGYDTGDIYEELLNNGEEQFKKYFREIFREVDLILVNGFDEFTNHETEIITRLSEIEGARLYLNFDYYKFNPMVFLHLDNCYRRLELKGFQKIEEESPLLPGEFRTVIRERLFRSASTLSTNKYRDKIFRITAPTREKEVEYIGKRIKSIVEREQVPLHKICIAYNLIDKYSPIIRDIFSRQGIKFNLTDRIRLDMSGPVAAMLNILKIPDNDYYYKDILRGAGNPFIHKWIIDPHILLRTATDLKIVIGKNQWIKKTKSASDNIPESDKEREYQKKIWYRAHKQISALSDLFEPLLKPQPCAEFLGNLKAFGEKIGINRYLITENDIESEKNIRALTMFFELASEILTLHGKENESKKYSYGFFLELLRSAASNARFNTREETDAGIQITTVNEIRGLEFDYLFIGGLTDGDFPTRFSPEIFYSGKFARIERMHQTEQRYSFYQSLCSWKKELYLTSPEMSESRELVESNFLKDFTRLFEVTDLKAESFTNIIATKEEAVSTLSVEDEIEEQIKADNLRMSRPDNESIFGGYILGAEEKKNNPAVEKLEELAAKQFSVSELEIYALCPYRYHALRMLRLEEEEEPTGEMEAVELGSVIHEILHKFFTSLREENIFLESCDDNSFNRAVNLIFDTGVQTLEKYFGSDFENFSETELILGIGGNKSESILYKLLENEREGATGRKPSFFEAGFGQMKKIDSDNELGKELPYNTGKVKLRGKIDRIDLDEKNMKYSVIDYKTGSKVPLVKELREGFSLQLPVYLAAAGEMLKDKYGCDVYPEEMEIYTLKFNKEKFGRHAIKPGRKNEPDFLQEIMASAKEFIEKYVRDISEGKFHLSLLEDRENRVCQYCAIKPVCRVMELNG